MNKAGWCTAPAPAPPAQRSPLNPSIWRWRFVTFHTNPIRRSLVMVLWLVLITTEKFILQDLYTAAIQLHGTASANGTKSFPLYFTQPRTPAIRINPAESRVHLSLRNRNAFIKTLAWRIFHQTTVPNWTVSRTCPSPSWSRLNAPGQEKVLDPLALVIFNPSCFPSLSQWQPCQQVYGHDCGGRKQGEVDKQALHHKEYSLLSSKVTRHLYKLHHHLAQRWCK